MDEFLATVVGLCFRMHGSNRKRHPRSLGVGVGAEAGIGS